VAVAGKLHAMSVSATTNGGVPALSQPTFASCVFRSCYKGRAALLRSVDKVLHGGGGAAPRVDHPCYKLKGWAVLPRLVAVGATWS
jgi:hypothetical protein